MTRQLRHAIIGCGRVAPNHLDGFRACSHSTVSWACDRDADVLSEFADTHDLKDTAIDYRSILNDDAVDSVSITVDHGQHAMLVREALQAGKHVLVEKPFVLNLLEGRELAELAENSGLILAVVSQHRFDPLVRRIGQLIKEGALGELVSIWASLQCGRDHSYYQDSYWRGTRQHEGGSALINQAYHCADLASWIGGPVRSVQAIETSVKFADTIETEDTLNGIICFESGATGTLSVTTASPVFWRSRIDVIGQLGAVTFDIDHPNLLHFCSLPESVENELRQIVEENANLAPAGTDYYGLSHRFQIDEFVRNILFDAPRTFTVHDALETLELIMSLYQSASQSRQTVSNR